jgi:hypothetical protein
MDPLHRRFYREGFWDGITTAALAVCALLLSASCDSTPVAVLPTPGEIVCGAAADCGVFGEDPAEIERLTGRCVATWDPAPAVAGIASQPCLDVILADYSVICPFFLDPGNPLPEECQTE